MIRSSTPRFDPLMVESTQKRLIFFSRKASFFDRPKILTKLNDINRARHIKACKEKSGTPKR